jgi:hypothetical protein
MHAKRTLFNYGKIFVITRPLPSTIPIPTLFSQPSCLTLQQRGPLTIRNYSTSSGRVLNSRATRTQVGSPFSHILFSLQRSITRVVNPSLVLTIRLVPPLGGASPPAKRGRGRPKGSKNKKSAADTAASTSELAPAAGEKRKRGRPPKVCSAELILPPSPLPPHTPPMHRRFGSDAS